jgi:tight adherence protein C
MIALAVAVAIGLLSLAIRTRPIEPGAYLGDAQPSRPRTVGASRLPGGAVRGAGVGWLAGATVGKTIELVVLGAMAGAVITRAVASTRRERRGRRLLQELPTITDTLALHVLAGESVAGAIQRTLERCHGVAADELGAAMAEPDGLEPGLRRAALASSHSEAARLYELLAHAHRTGGRLPDALAELAADFRSGIVTALTAEGGRRALASYGPILAFMIPVTLVFLMYPTLAGLSALASRP